MSFKSLWKSRSHTWININLVTCQIRKVLIDTLSIDLMSMCVRKISLVVGLVYVV